MFWELHPRRGKISKELQMRNVLEISIVLTALLNRRSLLRLTMCPLLTFSQYVAELPHRRRIQQKRVDQI
jgi:hypothetical protein